MIDSVGTNRKDRITATESRRARQRSLVVFHLTDQAYALDLREVEEIVPLPRLAGPPNLPWLLAGFLNLAGSAIPVLRLDRLFERPEIKPGRYSQLLLLRNPDCRLALLVDRVSRILTVEPEGILPLHEGQSLNDCVDGMITLDGHVVLLLSAETILFEKEQQCLAEFQDKEQTRLRGLEDPRGGP